MIAPIRDIPSAFLSARLTVGAQSEREVNSARHDPRRTFEPYRQIRDIHGILGQDSMDIPDLPLKARNRRLAVVGKKSVVRAGVNRLGR